MNVIRFLLGVTAVVALTGFAPAVSKAEEPLRTEKMICTPLVYEHEVGGDYQHFNLFRFERHLTTKDNPVFCKAGINLLEGYWFVTEKPVYPRGSRWTVSYGSGFTPSLEIGRKFRPSGDESLSFYSSVGLLTRNHYLDTGIILRSRWSFIKAGIFHAKMLEFHDSLEQYTNPDAGKPVAMTYISFGVGPSFRF